MRTESPESPQPTRTLLHVVFFLGYLYLSMTFLLQFSVMTLEMLEEMSNGPGELNPEDMSSLEIST